MSKHLPKPEILIPSQNEIDMFATPYVHDPSLPQHVQDLEFDYMIDRAIYCSMFISGEITYDDYLEGCRDTGLDAHVLDSVWQEKGCFL